MASIVVMMTVRVLPVTGHLVIDVTVSMVVMTTVLLLCVAGACALSPAYVAISVCAACMA